MIKRLARVLATSLLIVCMMGGTVSAAPAFHYCHQYAFGVNLNISSWYIIHIALPRCYEYHWVSEEYEYCTEPTCTARKNVKHYENILHNDCGMIEPRRQIR